MSDENLDRCPQCNAELTPESASCPECGSEIPGRDSGADKPPAEDVLGFSVVQGSGFEEDEYVPPPPQKDVEPAVKDVTAESEIEPEQTRDAESSEGDGALELESLVDPAHLTDASEAKESFEGGIELESMIPAPSAPPSVPEDLDLDLSLEDEPQPKPNPVSVSTPVPPPQPPREPAGAKKPDGEKPAKAPRSTARSSGRSRKSVGVGGILLSLILLLVVGGVGWVVAGTPGASKLRAIGIPIPEFGGPEGIRYVTNMLVDPIEILVDDSLYAVVQPGARHAVPVSVGEVLTWSLVRPEQQGGLSAGEAIVSAMPEPMVAGKDEHYRVNNQSPEYWIFAPLITNTTGRDMVALVNAGTGREKRCGCVIPNGARDYHIGYYGLEAGLDIRFFEAESGYEGRYREARDVAETVATNSGTVSVRIPRR